jgi:hypothetical protein
VAQIEVVAAIDAARHDETHRGRKRLHVPDLHRRGVSAKQRRRFHLRRGKLAGVRTPHAADDRRAEVEGVLHVARGMIRRHVERFEVVVVVFDLGPFEHLVAHVGEDVLDLLPHLHQRMHAPDRHRARGQRDIHGAGRRPRRFKRGAPRLDRRLDPHLERVDGLAEVAPSLGRLRRDALEERRYAAGVAAQKLIVESLEGLRRRRQRELLLEELPQRRDGWMVG